MVTSIYIKVLVQFVGDIEKDEGKEEAEAGKLGKRLNSEDFGKAVGMLVRGQDRNVERVALERVDYEECVPFEGSLPKLGKVTILSEKEYDKRMGKKTPQRTNPKT